MIDLHIHSNFSDGSDDYTDILKKAEKLGLKYISINKEQIEHLKRYCQKKWEINIRWIRLSWY